MCVVFNAGCHVLTGNIAFIMENLALSCVMYFMLEPNLLQLMEESVKCLQENSLLHSCLADASSVFSNFIYLVCMRSRRGTRHVA